MKNKSRKSYRLRYWNYANDGHYFVTICTKNKKHCFGKIVDGGTSLNRLGRIAHQCWENIPKHFPHVELDEFIIMPNHIHGIIIIKNHPVGTQNFASLQNNYSNHFGPQSKNLSSIIRGFKIGVKKFATINNIPFAWQSRFYDRIIRDEFEWYFMREYIANNPANWRNDKLFTIKPSP